MVQRVYIDVKDVIQALNSLDYTAGNHIKWLDWAKGINAKYPACLPEYRKKETPINPYVFVDSLFKNLSEDEQIERVYEHLQNKYGENGYAKFYLEDKEFENALQKLREELSNKENFIKRTRKVVKEI